MGFHFSWGDAYMGMGILGKSIFNFGTLNFLKQT